MRATREQGFATVQYVVVSSLSLVLLVLTANVLVDLYARGVIRDALDEGARAATLADAGATDCDARAAEVVEALLRGPIGADVRIACEVDGPWIVARASGSLPSWLPLLVPDWEVRAEAAALRTP